MLVPQRHKSHLETLKDDALEKSTRRGHYSKKMSLRDRAKSSCVPEVESTATTNLLQLQSTIQESALQTITDRRKQQRQEDYTNLMSHVIDRYGGNCEPLPPRSNKSLLEPDDKQLLKFLRKETTNIDSMEDLRSHMTMKIMWLIQERNVMQEKADIAEEKYRLLLQNVHNMDAQKHTIAVKLSDVERKFEDSTILHREIEAAFKTKSQKQEDDYQRLKERFLTLKSKFQQLEKERKNDLMNGLVREPGSPLALESPVLRQMPALIPTHENLSEEIDAHLAGMRPLQLLQDELNHSASEQLFQKCKELAQKLVDSHQTLQRAGQNEKAYLQRVNEAEEEMTRARDAYDRLQRIHEEDIKQHQTLLVHLRDKHIDQLRDIENVNVKLEAEAQTLRNQLEDLKGRHKALLSRMRELQEITLKSPSVPVLLNRLQAGESSSQVAHELKSMLEALLTFHNAESSGITRAFVKQKATVAVQTVELKSPREEAPQDDLVTINEDKDTNEVDDAQYAENGSVSSPRKQGGNNGGPPQLVLPDLGGGRKRANTMEHGGGKEGSPLTLRIRKGLQLNSPVPGVSPIAKEEEVEQPDSVRLSKKIEGRELDPSKQVNQQPTPSNRLAPLKTGKLWDAALKAIREKQKAMQAEKTQGEEEEAHQQPAGGESQGPQKRPKVRNSGVQTDMVLSSLSLNPDSPRQSMEPTPPQTPSLHDLVFQMDATTSEQLKFQVGKLQGLLDAERKINQQRLTHNKELEQETKELKTQLASRTAHVASLEESLQINGNTITMLNTKNQQLFREMSQYKEAAAVMGDLHSKSFLSIEDELRQAKIQIVRLQSGDAIQDLARKEAKLAANLEKVVKADESIDGILACYTCMRTIRDAVVVIPCGHIFCFQCFEKDNPDRGVVDTHVYEQGAWRRKVGTEVKRVVGATVAAAYYFCGECKKACVETYCRLPIFDEVISKQIFKTTVYVQLKRDMRVKVLDTSHETAAVPESAGVDLD